MKIFSHVNPFLISFSFSLSLCCQVFRVLAVFLDSFERNITLNWLWIWGDLLSAMSTGLSALSSSLSLKWKCDVSTQIHEGHDKKKPLKHSFWNYPQIKNTERRIYEKIYNSGSGMNDMWVRETKRHCSHGVQSVFIYLLLLPFSVLKASQVWLLFLQLNTGENEKYNHE